MLRNWNSMRLKSTAKWFIVTCATVAISGITMSIVAASDAPRVAQAVEPVAVVDRLSWGAVIAGVFLALIIQLALNLGGISMGFASLNPAEEQDLGGAVKSLTSGTAIWMGVSTLIALFVGGWVAARFSGMPNQVDGLLHGLLVWAVAMLISVLFLFTSLGRMISGISNLIGRTLNLAGKAVEITAKGTANVAEAAAHGAANVAQAAAEGVGNVAQSAAHGVNNAAQSAADQVGDLANRASNGLPGTNTGVSNQSISFDRILEEARHLLTEAGVPMQHIEEQVAAARGDVQQAAREISQNPTHAETTLTQTLERILTRGEAVASDVDRQTVVNLLVNNTNLNEAQAKERLHQWEVRAQQLGQEAASTVRNAQMSAEQARNRVESNIQQARSQIENKVEDIRDEAEHAAQEIAQQTSEVIAKIAFAVVAMIIIGGFAAGVGGYLGVSGLDNLPQQTTLVP